MMQIILAIFLVAIGYALLIEQVYNDGYDKREKEWQSNDTIYQENGVNKIKVYRDEAGHVKVLDLKSDKVVW